MTSTPSKNERYNAREAEARWQKIWDEQASSRPKTTTRGRNITCSRCSPTRRGASIWAMCATTRWATWSRATSARRASTCCIRWAGTPSACRPRTPRWSARSIPKAWTYDNIATMRKQLKSMGLSLDWAREIATCDPAYYKHQQKMFLDFLEGGAGRAQAIEGQLGSGRSDRARQRAGDRRPRLALRRAGRAARADAVVLQDHRLFGRICSTRSTRSTAGRTKSG